MAKPYAGMPLRGGRPDYTSGEGPMAYVHPITYKPKEVDAKIPSDLYNARTILDSVIKDFDYLIGDFEKEPLLFDEALVTIRKDWQAGELKSHEYYVSRDRTQRIPLLIYDYIGGCLLLSSLWNPEKIEEMDNKCKLAMEKNDQNEIKEYCLDYKHGFDRAIVEDYEKDCALLRYAIGALQAAKIWTELAYNDISHILGYPVKMRNQIGELVNINREDLLKHNFKRLSYIGYEMLDGGYKNVGSED